MKRQNTRMKTYRLSGLLLLVALLGFVGVGSAQTISDLSPSHWAYEAVQDLIARGYLALDDGRFQGDESVDRYFFVSTVARLLREIETGAVAPQSQADVELLRRIVNEYREDLVQALARVEETENKLAQTDKELATADETISMAIDRLSLLQQQGEDLDRRHNQLASDLQNEISQLRTLMDTLSVNVREQTSVVREETATDQAAMRQEIAGLLTELRQENTQQFNAMKHDLETQTTQLQTELNDLRQAADLALSEIQSQLNAHAETLAAQQMALENQDQQFLATIEAINSSLTQLDSAVRQVRAEVNALTEISTRLDRLQARLDNVERQTLAMQSQIGLSEEQLAALSQRLMNELDSRYQHSFLLSGNVSSELRSLREEFTSYREKTEQDLARARQAQTMGIVGAVLGLIGLLN